MNLTLHNTLTGNKDVFKSLEEGKVRMYNCGPTAYDRQHIGNLSMFVFTDILRKTLEYSGFKVNQVINITDFGHLSGDNEGKPDEGEDKMSKGLAREGLAPTLENMRSMAQKYAEFFWEDIAKLNIDITKITFPFASDYIKEQIKMIEMLVAKGFAYPTSRGVYFDTSKFKEYGKLGQINLDGLESGARVEIGEKKNPTDFVLWKSDPKMGWESPWGFGFPGWHIECSAMIVKILGEQIDIHTGGIEHIAIHHNNEIAQAEAATGKKPFSKFWLHRAHLKVDDAKIGKSNGNAIYLSDLASHRIHPISFRYFLLMSHYRTPANFTWEAVEAAQNALESILVKYRSFDDKSDNDKKTIEKFEAAIYDDLNTAIGIATLQEASSKKAIDKIDSILNLSIRDLSTSIFEEIPEEILDLKKERDLARAEKQWEKSDILRKDIEDSGFVIEDGPTETIVRKTLKILADNLK